MTPWPGGPPTSCAAPTPRSSSSCAVPWPTPGGCPARSEPCAGPAGHAPPHPANRRLAPSWPGPLGHDRFAGRGQVEDKCVIPQVEPGLAPPRAGRGEPARADVVVIPAAVVDAYLPDARPSLRQIGAHRDAQLDG